MAKQTPTIIIPNVTLPELKFALQHMDHPLTGIVKLTWAMLTRAQITLYAGAQLEEREEAQTFMSCKYYASTLLTQDGDVSLLNAYTTIHKSAFIDANEYSKLQQFEKPDFIKNKASQLFVRQKGTVISKVLTPQQIASPQDALIHRRGVMNKNRGTWQAKSIWYPNDLVKGASVVNLNFQQYVEGLEKLWKELGLTHGWSQLRDENHGGLDGYDGPEVAEQDGTLQFGNPGTENPWPNNESYADANLEYSLKQELVEECIRSSIEPTVGDKLHFADGMILTKEGNLVPLELPFGDIIERTGPTDFSIEFDRKQAAEDSFLTAALAQGNEIQDNKQKKRNRSTKNKVEGTSSPKKPKTRKKK